MASPYRPCLHFLERARLLSRSSALAHRSFHSARVQRTDGVFNELQDARISIPWIQAFESRRDQDATAKSPPAKTSPTSESVKRDLRPKKMQESHHSLILPLRDQPFLSDTYLNSSGHIRLGTIFMDLDALSGIIAYKHTGPGVTTVTAALDRITIAHPLTEICNLQYSGQVTYATGRSSMEITCKVSKAPAVGQDPKAEDVLLTCTFTMVSLDPTTRKAVPIPALEITTPAEQAIYDRGEQRSKAKKALASSSLLTTPPDQEEAALIHRIWQRQLAYHDPNNPLRQPASVHTMASTRLQTASIMQPQYRNRHNFMIFGGFLLKSTFELAFCCAASFAHARPSFIQADPCTFLAPVPVGSVLYLTATVAYTDPPLVDGNDEHTNSRSSSPAPSQGDSAKRTRVHVRVDSKVRDVEHGTAKPSGTFNYTFTVDREVHVMPQTYTEHLMFVDARRRAINSTDFDEVGAKAGLSDEVARRTMTE